MSAIASVNIIVSRTVIGLHNHRSVYGSWNNILVHIMFQCLSYQVCAIGTLQMSFAARCLLCCGFITQFQCLAHFTGSIILRSKLMTSELINRCLSDRFKREILICNTTSAIHTRRVLICNTTCAIHTRRVLAQYKKHISAIILLNCTLLLLLSYCLSLG